MDEDAANDGPGEFSNADERIYALLAVVEDQQNAVRAGIQGLAQERAALATERVALVQQAEQLKRLTDKLVSAIGSAIPQMAQTAAEASRAALSEMVEISGEAAAKAAAKMALPELAKFTAAVEAAAVVQRQLGAAVKDFRRKWAWVVAFAIAAMVLSGALVAYGAAWWQLRELSQLQAQRDQLSAEVKALQEQAEQARRSSVKKPASK